MLNHLYSFLGYDETALNTQNSQHLAEEKDKFTCNPKACLYNSQKTQYFAEEYYNFNRDPNGYFYTQKMTLALELLRNNFCADIIQKIIRILTVCNLSADPNYIQASIAKIVKFPCFEEERLAYIFGYFNNNKLSLDAIKFLSKKGDTHEKQGKLANTKIYEYMVDNLSTSFLEKNNYGNKNLMKKKSEIMLAEAQSDLRAIDYVGYDLKSDKDFMLKAIKISGLALEYASHKLRADKEVVLAAVQQDGSALEFAHSSLKDDKEIVLAALRQDSQAIQFANPLLQRDQDIINAANRQE